ncbi:type iii restriction-modification system methylation subunit [hydrocarbon metagenome]|uniref:Type iii restriction-modification system methylation subunit n=1 Tax=hydrocarbon metagenome TaxID=938273 RepID=A0A0W8FG07_9ZZZZ
MDPNTAKHHEERLKRHKQQLKQKLTELFQIDSPDLDFGVYRIMNQKRDEITRFMDKDLIEAVDAEFGKYDTESRTRITSELSELEQIIRNTYGDDALDANGLKEEYRKTARGRELHEKWQKLHRDAEEASMSDLQKAEIFAHLEEFFSRYYKDGDFLSLRRYAANEKYAVPYNGEEVLLHWANKDQYYIKTDRFLKSHGFDVGSYRVLFEVVQVEGQSNGNSTGRYFVLAGDDAVTYDAEKRLLTARFAQVTLSDDDLLRRFPPGAGRQKPNQDDIVAGLVAEILRGSGIPKGLADALQTNERDTDKNPRLYKHVMSFTRENTSDFFIHKDLGGFLRQELDFYIKNEVFRLDDLGTENEVAVERYVKRAKVLKSIAHRIIDFLAQLEDFQKMLWEKKKFVLRTGYCMTLDQVPEEFYPEILANEKQLAEWRNLYGIGEARAGQTTLAGDRVDEAFLQSHPYLVIDTAFFDDDFTDRLLEHLQQPDGTPVEDLDEAIGGLMIKSENWQALNLLQERYREQVKCIYIDPPYNTGNDEFVYRDNYQHSSWLSMMGDRLQLSKSLMHNSSTIWISNDDNENFEIISLLYGVFGEKNFFSEVIVRANSRGQTYKPIAKTHEYVSVFTKKDDEAEFFELEKSGVSDDLNMSDEIGNFNIRELRNRNPKFGKHNRPNLFYPVYVNPNIYDHDGFHPVYLSKEKDYCVEVLPLNSEGMESCWRWGKDKLSRNTSENPLRSNIVAKQKRTGEFGIYEKYRKTTYKPKSIWTENEFLTETGTIEIGNMGLGTLFSFPKPSSLIMQCVALSSKEGEVVLDYFAGSGTTAHAVLNLQKEDDNNRPYILVEIGDYFDSVIIPRIEKVMYSSNWKDGKPQDTDGQSHIFKYMELEQYEDTLNNIEFLDRDGHVQATIFGMSDYMLRYFLDVETRESPCRLNVDRLATPFAYTLRVRRDVGFDHVPVDEDGFREVTVDLVETFNYLLGLHVRRRVTRHQGGLTYRIVHGVLPDGKVATIVWRNCPKNPAGHEQALEADAAFITDEILGEYPDTGVLYVNGHCFAPRATPIEPEFKKRMGA